MGQGREVLRRKSGLIQAGPKAAAQQWCPSAENATINANGSVLFSDSSSASTATINANGTVVFQASATAGNANLM